MPWREIGLSLTFAALVVLVLKIRWLSLLAASLPLRYVGYRAYSLFLIHQSTVWFFAQFSREFLGFSDGPAFAFFLWSAGLLVVLVIGEVFFRVVEKPSIGWAKSVSFEGSSDLRV